MSSAYNTPRSQHNTPNGSNHHHNNSDASLNAILASHLHRDTPQSMDGRQSEYPQSGLSSPYAPYNGHHSEGSSADQASAVQYQPGQDYKSSNFSSSATPDSSYSLQQTGRSGSFPEYINRNSYNADGTPSRYPQGAQSGHAAMAQTSNPSIAQSSPTYPAQNYSPYGQHEMQHYGAQPMTSYGRPEWAGQYQQPMPYGHAPSTTAGGGPAMVAHSMPRPTPGGHPLSTVYSFVPIPGAQQHKRPRRRYEEIERMYKCGWNGCEKAYGTLNHLNAHVTMQSHEFKEIRKEWKAKKKEEENLRKAEEERQRQEAARSGQDTSQSSGQPAQYGQHNMMPPQMGGPHLPPIGYQPAAGQAAGQYAQPQQVDGSQQYGGAGQMYSTQGYPQSPYGQGGVQYQQRA